jgi:hypothetical protein
VGRASATLASIVPGRAGIRQGEAGGEGTGGDRGGGASPPPANSIRAEKSKQPSWRKRGPPQAHPTVDRPSQLQPEPLPAPRAPSAGKRPEAGGDQGTGNPRRPPAWPPRTWSALSWGAAPCWRTPRGNQFFTLLCTRHPLRSAPSLHSVTSNRSSRCSLPQFPHLSIGTGRILVSQGCTGVEGAGYHTGHTVVSVNNNCTPDMGPRDRNQTPCPCHSAGQRKTGPLPGSPPTLNRTLRPQPGPAQIILIPKHLIPGISGCSALEGLLGSGGGRGPTGRQPGCPRSDGRGTRPLTQSGYRSGELGFCLLR